MNWITIAVIGIMIIFAFYGWYKGILRIILSLAATIVTILVTIFVAPAAGKLVKDNTDIYDKFEKTIEKTIEKNGAYDKAVAEVVPEEQQTEYLDANREISTYVSNVVALLNLPASMEKEVDATVSEDSVNQLIENETSTVKSAITHIIADRLATVIFNSIIYMIIFMIIFAIFRILISVTGVIGKLPIIHEANKIGGLVFGLVEGLLVVWALFMVITLFSSNEWASDALADINNNKILEFIYNNNLILKSTFRNV